MKGVTKKPEEEKMEYAAAVAEAKDRIIKEVIGIQHELGVSDRDIEEIFSELSKLWTAYKRGMTEYLTKLGKRTT